MEGGREEVALILVKYKQYQCYVTGVWRLEGGYYITKAVSKRRQQVVAVVAVVVVVAGVGEEQ